jgi:hypothetical protein
VKKHQHEPVVRRSFHRRSLLRALAGAPLIGGPLLRAHGAQAATSPRVLLFYVGGGLRMETWRQGLGSGTALATAKLQNGLDVFEADDLRALKAKMTVVDGVNFAWGRGSKGGRDNVDVHRDSPRCSLVAAHTVNLAGRVSLDRVLAEKIGEGAYRSVRLKVVRGRYDHGVPSLGGSASLSTTFTTPADAYRELFSGQTPSTPTQTPTPAAPNNRRDVVAQSLAECTAVVGETERQLGKEAAARVQDHCDSLRDMERRLAASGTVTPPPPGGRCAPGAAPAPGGANFENLATAMDAHSRVAVNALACGRTRVLLYELWTDQPENRALFLDNATYKGMDMHQQFLHSSTGPDGAVIWPATVILAAQQAYTRFLMRRFGDLVKQADGLGLLEDTIILWVTNEPTGGHSYDPVGPCLYAGNGGGRFVTGKYLQKSVGINDIYTSLLRGVGVDMPRFGDDNSGRATYSADDLILAR